MTDLFYGGEMDSVTPSDSNVYEETTAGTFDTSRARCSIGLGLDANYAQSPVFSGQTAVWFHFRSYITRSFLGGNCEVIKVFGGSTAMARVYSQFIAGVQTLYLQWSSAGTWTTLDSVVLAVGNVLQTYDLYVNKTTGALSFYISGGLALSGTATLSGFSDITKCRWHGSSSHARGHYISELCGSTSTTIGMGIWTCPPTGDGANTAWTGSSGDVDEIVCSDADGITSASADQVETFTNASIVSALGSAVVRGVGVCSRTKQDGSGPTQLQLALRTGGSNYFSATNAVDFGYAPIPGVWETNPDTTAAWTASEASGAEFGVKSIA